MGGELLTSPEGGEKSPPVKYTEVFYESLPFYLSIGMSMAEFWNGDNTLTKVYRKAYEFKKEQRNHELWLQGMYIYEALLCVSPTYRDFVKDHKAMPYPDKPYELYKKEEPVENKEEKKMLGIMDKVQDWATRLKKKEKKDG